jgi:hypothetical protein
VQSVVIAFAISGLSLLLAAQFTSRDFRSTDEQSNERYSQDLPNLQDGSRKQNLAQSTADFLGQLPLLAQRKRRHDLALITGCILLRVVTLVEIVRQRGCSRRGVEVRGESADNL